MVDLAGTCPNKSEQGASELSSCAVPFASGVSQQTESENKSRALKVLQAHNAGLTRELGQVDMSLMQALEDNGLTLDSVKLQNTPMSRRIGRRR